METGTAPENTIPLENGPFAGICGACARSLGRWTTADIADDELEWHRREVHSKATVVVAVIPLMGLTGLGARGRVDDGVAYATGEQKRLGPVGKPRRRPRRTLPAFGLFSARKVGELDRRALSDIQASFDHHKRGGHSRSRILDRFDGNEYLAIQIDETYLDRLADPARAVQFLPDVFVNADAAFPLDKALRQGKHVADLIDDDFETFVRRQLDQHGLLDHAILAEEELVPQRHVVMTALGKSGTRLLLRYFSLCIANLEPGQTSTWRKTPPAPPAADPNKDETDYWAGPP